MSVLAETVVVPRSKPSDAAAAPEPADAGRGVRTVEVDGPIDAGRAVATPVRRGRPAWGEEAWWLLATAAMSFLVVLAFGFIGSPDASSGPVERIEVRAGQSLWEIADRVAPNVDPRLTVDQIVRLNSLDGATVHAGQGLVVPVGRG